MNTHRLLESISPAAHVIQTAVKALIASKSSEESVWSLTLKKCIQIREHFAIVLLPGESKVVSDASQVTDPRQVASFAENGKQFSV